MDEPNIDKKQVSIRAERILCRCVEKKFGKPNEDKVVAYIRALEEATRGFKLTAQDYAEIAKDAQAAYDKRMAKRHGNRR